MEALGEQIKSLIVERDCNKHQEECLAYEVKTLKAKIEVMDKSYHDLRISRDGYSEMKTSALNTVKRIQGEVTKIAQTNQELSDEADRLRQYNYDRTNKILEILNDKSKKGPVKLRAIRKAIPWE